LLSQRGVEYHCEIVGGGELQSELQQQIDLLGVAEQVRLMGCQPQFVVKQMIQSAAVLAAPCVVSQDGNRDGLPTVLIEAMALGTPCISTAVTGIPEIVRHDQTGWIVPENSPSELAGSLSKMVDDSALRLRLAENGRRLVEQQFDIDRNSAQIRALFLAPADHNVPCSRLQAV
jgi:glycosyltransferase involved in cell wall biosynthesis